jgi:hypothetical protein
MSYEKNTYTDNPNQSSRNPFVNPPGANGVEGPTSELFEERKFYRDDVFNEFILGNDNLIDYWNKENFYGRINKKGMPIICNENALKAITSVQEGSNPLALNFVADAFDDMSDSFARLRQQGGPGAVSDSSVLYPLEAVNGWLSARDAYAEWISGIFDAFVNGYLRIDTEENRRVVDFSTFLNAFYKFTQLTTAGSPVTFSSFVLSSVCPAPSNGMIIDVYEGDSDDDLSKFLDCLSDSNFELYRKLAQNHGFLVDKNIPWRLVANLNHPYMLKKQKLNGFFGENNNLDQIFTFAFTQPHREDIDMLRIHLAGFYSSFIETFPELRLPVDRRCEGRRQVKTKVIPRKPLKDAFYSNGSLNPNSTYIKEYGDLFWLRFYLYLKRAELSRAAINLKDLDKPVKTLYTYYNIHGLTKAVDLINKNTFSRTTLRIRRRN